MFLRLLICLLPICLIGAEGAFERSVRRNPDSLGSGQDELSQSERKEALDGRLSQTDEESPPLQGGGFQVRGGYFRFANSTARKIYGEGIPDVEVEGIVFINRYFNPWINTNYIWKEGKTPALSSKTDLKMGIFSFGTKFFFPYRAVIRFYLGFGPCCAYLQAHDHSSFVPGKTVRWGGGVVGKSGLFLGNRHLFLDLFLDYYYLPIRTRSSVSENSIDLGGLRVGGGLGYIF